MRNADEPQELLRRDSTLPVCAAPTAAFAKTHLPVRQTNAETPGRLGILADRRPGKGRFRAIKGLLKHICLYRRGTTMRTCHDLAARIEKLQPEAMPCDVARLCLLLTNHVDDIDDLEDESLLSQAWQEMGMRLQAATDQHAAMTEDLELLARSDPSSFSMDQIWVLIRAIKVQSQILQLYVGQPPVDV